MSTHIASAPRSKCVKAASIRRQFSCVRFEIDKPTLFIPRSDPVSPISPVQVQAAVDLN